MAADLTRVKNLVTALLGASTRTSSGIPVFSATVGDNARHADEIEMNCVNAGMQVAQTVCEADSSPFRTAFLADTAVTHGAAIPFHYGDTSIPKITPFNGAAFTLRGVRRPFDKIESYRLNTNSVYAPTAHDASDSGKASAIAGFYDVVNGIFYFTGFSATMMLATFDRTNVFSRLQDSLEPTIVRLACAASAKDGDISDNLFSAWYAQAQNDLQLIRGGATAFQPVDEAIRQRGDSA